jgi:hypothetical protein
VGNPELTTLLKFISALGLQLHVSATDKASWLSKRPLEWTGVLLLRGLRDDKPAG